MKGISELERCMQRGLIREQFRRRIRLEEALGRRSTGFKKRRETLDSASGIAAL